MTGRGGIDVSPRQLSFCLLLEFECGIWRSGHGFSAKMMRDDVSLGST